MKLQDCYEKFNRSLTAEKINSFLTEVNALAPGEFCVHFKKRREAADSGIRWGILFLLHCFTEAPLFFRVNRECFQKETAKSIPRRVSVCAGCLGIFVQ